MTTPTPGLLQAFKETDYIVHSEPPFAMHIGQACPELMTLMAQHKAPCAFGSCKQRLNDSHISFEHAVTAT